MKRLFHGVLVMALTRAVFAGSTGELQPSTPLDLTDYGLAGRTYFGAAQAVGKGATLLMEMLQDVVVDKHVEKQLSDDAVVKEFLAKNPNKGMLVQIPVHFDPYFPAGGAQILGGPVFFGDGGDVGEAWDNGDKTPGIRSNDLPNTTLNPWATKWVWVTLNGGKLKFTWYGQPAVILAGEKHRALNKTAAVNPPANHQSSKPTPPPVVAPPSAPPPPPPPPHEVSSHENHGLDASPFGGREHEPPAHEPAHEAPAHEPPAHEPPEREPHEPIVIP